MGMKMRVIEPLFISQVSAAESNKKQDQLKTDITFLKQQLQQKEGEITQLKRDLHLAVTTLVSHLQLFETSTLALEKHAETYGRICSYLSRVMRKLVFGVSNQVQHKPGCTITEDC